MNEQELLKKLAVLKTQKPPKGYWDNYWPRLKMKLDRTPDPVESPAVPWFLSRISISVPALVGVLIGGILYRLAPWPPHKTSSIQMQNIIQVSDTSASKASRVFREMLQLFPSRINWISFADGKVDFSISSVAYKKDEALIPVMLSFPLGKEAVHVQLLIRPGQEARVHAPFQGKGTLDAVLTVDPKAKSFKADVSLAEGDDGVSLQAATPLKEGEAVTIGSVRWKGRLVPVHLARPVSDPA